MKYVSGKGYIAAI